MSGKLDRLLFPNHEQLLALPDTTSGRRVLLWNIATGKLEPPFDTAPPQGDAAVAVSWGGQFLALVDEERKLRIYDIPQGAEVGAIDLSRRADAKHFLCRGLAFAPDASELTGLFEHTENRVLHLLSWQLIAGELRLEHTYTRQELFNASGLESISLPALEWIPDGSGWLLCGRLLLDRDTGAHRLTVARASDEIRAATAHFIGPGWLAVLEEFRDQRRLSVRRVAAPPRQ